MIASRDRAQLLIVDLQQRLAPHVGSGADVTARCCKLARAARTLSVPITVSEHYPSGLGESLPEIKDACGEASVTLRKLAFSCMREPVIAARLGELAGEGRREVALAGMETHVCVMQTALDLLANDYEVFVVADAVGSRDPAARDLALQRMAHAGAALVTAEMLIFEWAERADDPRFKELLALVK
jgi:nicotinamidase-related amidase